MSGLRGILRDLVIATGGTRPPAVLASIAVPGCIPSSTGSAGPCWCWTRLSSDCSPSPARVGACLIGMLTAFGGGLVRDR